MSQLDTFDKNTEAGLLLRELDNLHAPADAILVIFDLHWPVVVCVQAPDKHKKKKKKEKKENAEK